MKFIKRMCCDHEYYILSSEFKGYYTVYTLYCPECGKTRKVEYNDMEELINKRAIDVKHAMNKEARYDD